MTSPGKPSPCSRIEHNLPRLLVLAQPDEEWMSDMPIPHPLDKAHLSDELRLGPMRARAKVARAVIGLGCC
jgi:hypothetical protein